MSSVRKTQRSGECRGRIGRTGQAWYGDQPALSINEPHESISGMLKVVSEARLPKMRPSAHQCETVVALERHQIHKVRELQNEQHHSRQKASHQRKALSVSCNRQPMV